MSSRDRKLLAVLAPLGAFAIYWVLLMSPALDRRSSLEEPVASARSERDGAVAQAAELQVAQKRYETDFAELVNLTKAIPQTVAVSDLMRELNKAAKGTNIAFNNITMGTPVTSSTSSPTPPPAPAPTPGATSTAAATTPPPVAPAPALDEIPVELTFDGEFFDLADLFHSVQRFVTVADGQLQVRGRLIRIDSFSFDSAAFPNITAQVGATVYAVPASQGPTDGATLAGPRGAERGDGGLKPVEDFSAAAVVTP
jgi:Pilus assembly protein, PilO